MAANRIQLDGESFVLEEAPAHEALSPGHLIEKNADSEVQLHATEGGFGLVMVAAEDALQGKTTDDAYAAADIVQCHIQRSGTRFQGLLRAGENVAIGDALVSGGDGTFIAATTASAVDQVMGYAEEALDLTGSGAVDTLVAIRAA